MIPAAVNHTDMNIDISWANRMDVEVFKMFRYCKISGTVISLTARRNLKPKGGKRIDSLSSRLKSCVTYDIVYH